MGPGGLGGTVAALLSQTGECEVTVVGRPGAHIEAIREHGLRLTGLRELTAEVNATDSAKAIEECDVLIYTIKAQDTQDALAATVHTHARELVTSLQNGTAKDDLLADAFGSEKVIGGLAVVAGERPEPGTVKWTYDGGTQFGELDDSSSERVDRLVDLFRKAGLVTDSSDAIVSSTWTKMVGWIPMGLIACLTRRNNAEVLSDRSLATEYVGMVRELNGLAEKKGIPMADIGPYHVRSWCEGTVEEAVDRATESPLAGSQSTHSALQDLGQGKRTEFNACVAPVIQEAAKLGVPLTSTRAMYSMLMALEDSLTDG